MEELKGWKGQRKELIFLVLTSSLMGALKTWLGLGLLYLVMVQAVEPGLAGRGWLFIGALLFLLGLEFLAWAWEGWRRRAMGDFKNKVREDFARAAIFEKVHLDDHLHVGEAASHLWMNVEWTGVYLYEALGELGQRFLEGAWAWLALAFWDLGLAGAVVLVMILLVLVNQLGSQRLASRSRKEAILMKDYSTAALEGLKGDLTLKTLNASQRYLDYLEEKSWALRQASMAFVRTSNVLFTSKKLLSTAFVYLFLLWALGRIPPSPWGLAGQGFHLFLLAFLFDRVRKMEGAFLKFTKGRSAWLDIRDRMAKVQAEKKARQGKYSVEEEKEWDREPAIAAQQVTYTYWGKNQPALAAVDLMVGGGEKVYLVGASGSGKSSLLRLVNGFDYPDQGQIRIFGQAICPATMPSLRGKIATVWQSNHVFSTSILENIRMAKKEADLAAVEKACQKARIYDFIRGLPQGFDTRVGQGGLQLSGGQQQRLALARAYLRDAPILILDEPTSQLDRTNERMILESLRELAQKKTVLASSHRLEMILEADQIYLLEGGRILAQGSHEQLAENSTAYQQLFQLGSGEGRRKSSEN